MEANIYYFLVLLSFIGKIVCSNKDIGFEDKTNDNSADKRFKRVIEYTRWRMATRTTPDFFFRQEDDDADMARPTVKATEYKHETENVFIADAVPKSSAVVEVVDGITKEYTRFVTPKKGIASNDVYHESGFASSIQDSSVTDPNSQFRPTIEENVGEISTDIQEIVGVNQNSHKEAQTIEVPYQNPFEISHQVAPLAPVTSPQESTEYPVKPDPLERIPFAPAQPPFQKPLRTNYVTDIFVPTRMYITSITEDVGDFLSMSPDKEKYFISSPSHIPIESIHKTIQIDFPHLSRSPYIDELKTNVNNEKLLQPTEPDNKITPIFNNDEDAVEGNDQMLPVQTEYTTDSTYSKILTDHNMYEMNTYNDYIEEKKTFADKTGLEQNTLIIKESEKENEISSTLEADYTISKDSDIYHKDTEKEHKHYSTSRLDQFYDNIYMKYEVPREPVSIPKKQIILDKTEYEEEDNIEPTPPKSLIQLTMAPEIDSKVNEPAVTMTPFIESYTFPVHNIDVGDEEEEAEQEEKTIGKVIEKTASVETTESLTNLFQITTEWFKAVSEQGQNDVYAPSEGVCSLVKLSPLNFQTARNLYEINIQLQMWSQNPMVKIVDITEGNLTYMENSINMVIIDDKNSGKDPPTKVTVMIVAGIYGRDHAAVSSAMFLLHQLIEKKEIHKTLLSKYRFLIIPVLNPDGYHYSTTFPKQRQWLKNLHQYYEECIVKECESCFLRGTHCKIKSCYGVNLDRNFAYQWIPEEQRQATNVCDNFYAGEKSLSELESQALYKYLMNETTKPSVFLSLKEGDVLGIMYPYSNTKNSKAFASVSKQKALRAATAAYSVSGRLYVAGQMSEFLPSFSGGLEDFVDHHLSINNVYTVMMSRPSNSSNTNITMEHMVHEAYAAFNSLFLLTSDNALPPMQLKHHATISKARTNEIFLLNMLLTIILTWR